jgi:hemolysin activation/secretion protein
MIGLSGARRWGAVSGIALAAALAVAGPGVQAQEAESPPGAEAEPVAPAATPEVAPPPPSGSTGLGQTDAGPAALAPPTAPAITARPAAPAQAACPFAGQGQQVTLTGVRADGASQLTPQEISAEVADLLNRPQDLAVICDIRDRIADLYASRGRRLTRVELPEQTIADGVLTLRVTEGRIAETDIVNGVNQGPSAVLAEAYLERLETGEPASWPDVERAILLLRELPGAEVDVRLRPSTAGAGAVDAVATFQPRRRFDLILGAQHLGSEELGESAVLARLDANGFTRFGERTSLILFSTTNGAQQVLQLLEEVRLGGSGLTGFADIAFGRTQPEGALSRLKIEGEALIGRIGLDYPVIKTQSVGLNVGGRFDHIDQENDLGALRGLGSAAVLFEEQLRVLTLETDARWRPDRFPGLAALAGAELRKGIEGLGSSEAGDQRLSREEGRPDFTSLRARLALRQDFAREARVSFWIRGQAEAQWADGPLLAYEEYQIGNYSLGRGYDPGAASGDIAVGGRIEAGLRFQTRFVNKNAVFEPFLFVDAVRLENEDRFGYESEIWSYGGGVNFTLARDLQLSVIYADPQEEPFPNADVPEPRLLVQLTRAFHFR